MTKNRKKKYLPIKKKKMYSYVVAVRVLVDGGSDLGISGVLFLQGI